MKKINITIVFCFFVLFLCPDAFSQAGKLTLATKSRYFTVYGYAGFDPDSFARKIDFDYLSQPETLLDESDLAATGLLGKTLDALYLEVSDILDLHSYNFRGTLKIVSTQRQVSDAFKGIYGRDFPERSLFVLEENTIYISDEDATLGMLGHEIAHAIICHYFVVPPPAKTQEVLAGYVEYSLRKKSGTLPTISTP